MRIYVNERKDIHRDDGLPAIVTKNTIVYMQNGRNHRADGPAVITKRGTEAYYWNGVGVPTELWLRCEKIDGTEIMAIENVELRRAIIEKVGIERLRDCAEHIDTYKSVKLFRMQMVGDEDLVFLECIDQTPGPDGERKLYHIRVSPEHTSALEAVAESFNVTSGQYKELSWES